MCLGDYFVPNYAMTFSSLVISIAYFGFIDSMFVDLESLRFYGGIHEKHFGYYKMLAKRFPFAVYYDIEEDSVVVHAILDTRQNPNTIETRLSISS